MQNHARMAILNGRTLQTTQQGRQRAGYPAATLARQVNPLVSAPQHAETNQQSAPSPDQIREHTTNRVEMSSGGAFRKVLIRTGSQESLRAATRSSYSWLL